MEKPSNSEFPLVSRGRLHYASRRFPLMCNTAHCSASHTIAPHKDLRGSPRTHRSLAIFFRHHHIRTPDNSHAAESLYLRPRKLQPHQFSTACLKLRRRPQHIRLVLPLRLIRTDHNRVRRHQSLQRVRIICKPRPPHTLPHFQNLPALVLAVSHPRPQQQSQHKNPNCHPHDRSHVFLLLILNTPPATPVHQANFQNVNVHRATNAARTAANPAVSQRASVRRLRRLSLVRTRNRPRGNHQPIPRIDRHHRQCQITNFLLAESRAHLRVHRIGNMIPGHQRHSLRPRQRRPLALRVIRAFPPPIQRIHPLLRLPARPQNFPVHVQAECAAVHLRSSQRDQIKQPLFQSALPQIFLQPQHRSVRSRRRLHEIKSRFHKSSFSALQIILDDATHAFAAALRSPYSPSKTAPADAENTE